MAIVVKSEGPVMKARGQNLSEKTAPAPHCRKVYYSTIQGLFKRHLSIIIELPPSRLFCCAIIVEALSVSAR
jgi:hypothetical protein